MKAKKTVVLIYGDGEFEHAECLAAELYERYKVDYSFGHCASSESPEFIQKFQQRSRQKISECSAVYVLGSNALFLNPIMSFVAQNAISSGKAICITLPHTRNIPPWFPKKRSIELFTDTRMKMKGLDSVFKKSKALSLSEE